MHSVPVVEGQVDRVVFLQLKLHLKTCCQEQKRSTYTFITATSIKKDSESFHSESFCYQPPKRQPLHQHSFRPSNRVRLLKANYPLVEVGQVEGRYSHPQSPQMFLASILVEITTKITINYKLQITKQIKIFTCLSRGYVKQKVEV